MIAALLVPFALATEAPPYPEGGSTTPTGPLAHPAEGFGVGIILGLPTGISLGWRGDGPVHYDAALAWSFDRGTLALHADALFTVANMRTDDIPDTTWPVYVGVGPRIRVGEDQVPASDSTVSLAARVPVGLAVLHDGLPLEAFLELAPGVQVFPATVMTFDIAIGVRFYFGSSPPPPPATIPV